MKILWYWIQGFEAQIVFGLILVCVLLLILCIISIIQNLKLKRKYNFFMQGEKNINIEEVLTNNINRIDELSSQYNTLQDYMQDLERVLRKCIRKVDMLRYNPFDEMGGDLCFAIALLDEENSGLILNGIHSRDGSYVYAKAVEKGISQYKLSEEEKKVLNQAMMQ